MRDNARGNGLRFVLFGILVVLLAMTPLASLVAAEMPDRPADDNTTKEETNRESSKTVMILGLSWHSGFCEGFSRVPECKHQSASATAARQFSLNGLWRARKTYCGVPDALKEQDKNHKWLEMPELALDRDLKIELADAMPGMASGLERHEWIKHGTCSGEVAADYYARSLKMLAEVNGSAVQALFEGNLGKTLKEADVKAAFETAFGAGAGDKVKMRCRKDGDRQVITGVTIGLGKLDDGDLSELIAAAGRTKFGCAAGVVDEAGLQ
jgi:ribonuclease T2